jgi:prevent-host-death family protein
MTSQPVNIHYAKTHLSRLIEQVEAGDSVVIANAGRPVARLIPFDSPPRPVAAPGSLAGRGFSIGPDFDSPLEPLLGVHRPSRVAEFPFEHPEGQADGA